MGARDFWRADHRRGEDWGGWSGHVGRGGLRKCDASESISLIRFTHADLCGCGRGPGLSSACTMGVALEAISVDGYGRVSRLLGDGADR